VRLAFDNNLEDQNGFLDSDIKIGFNELKNNQNNQKMVLCEKMVALFSNKESRLPTIISNKDIFWFALFDKCKYNMTNSQRRPPRTLWA
jgi:hypothetical protein